MGHANAVEPGDLARRTTQRRQEIGLTIEELAKQADVDSGFLQYFERHSDMHLDQRTLIAIARALRTSPVSLLGGERNRAPGSADALPGAILEPLTPAQCRAHLEAGGVGRIVFYSVRGPIALPVNFQFSSGKVLFNTTVRRATELEWQGTVGFEVDHFDDVFSEGWSVIVTGSARRVDGPDELVEHAAHGVVPWAGGARGAVVAISANEVTGRVIIHDGSGRPTVVPGP